MEKFKKACKDTEHAHAQKEQELSIRDAEIEMVKASNKKLEDDVMGLKSENNKNMTLKQLEIKEKLNELNLAKQKHQEFEESIGQIKEENEKIRTEKDLEL